MQTAEATTDDALAGIRARLAGGTDFAFIRSSWVESVDRFWPYRSTSPGMDVIGRSVDRILPRLAAKSITAIAERDDRIVAWLMRDKVKPVVYFAYTVRAFRQQGLCRILLRPILGAKWTYAHDSGLAKVAADRIGGGMFNPYALTDALMED